LFHRKPTDVLTPLFQSRAWLPHAHAGDFNGRRHVIIYPLSALCFAELAAAMPQRITIIARGTEATELTKRFPAFIA